MAFEMKINAERLKSCERKPQKKASGAMSLNVPIAIGHRLRDYCIENRLVQAKVVVMLLEDFLQSVEK